LVLRVRKKHPMNQLYSVKEVAELFNLNYRSILNMITVGELKAYKIGGVYRISEKEIYRYLQSAEVESFWK